MIFSILVLLFSALPVLPSARAQESMTLSTADKNVSDALAKALKQVATKKISFPESNMLSILNEEVAPHLGQFISSYKVTDGSRNGWVNLEASVDISALRYVFAINQKNFKMAQPKALVLIRGHNGNSAWQGTTYDETEEELVAQLEATIQARLKRRGIQFLPRLNEYLDFVDEINENSAPRLKAIAQRVSADLIIYLASDFRADPSSGKSGTHFFLKGLIYDNQRDTILGSAEESIPMWIGEQAITSKSEKTLETVRSHINSTLHEMFMISGTKLLTMISSVSYVTLRVLEPPDYFSVEQLRDGIRQLKGVRYIVERKISSGMFDFWINSRVSAQRLKREIRQLRLTGYNLSILNRVSKTPEDDTISVRLKKKAPTSDSKHNDSRKRGQGA